MARLNPESGAIEAIIATEPGPLGIAIQGGHMWVVHPTGSLTRIDPQTNEVFASIPLTGKPQVAHAIDDGVWIPDPPARASPELDPAIAPGS